MSEEKQSAVKSAVTDHRFLWLILITSLSLHALGIRTIDQVRRNTEAIEAIQGAELGTNLQLMGKDIAQMNEKLGRIEAWQDRYTARMFPSIDPN